jgi:hypothetical protein
VKNFDTYDFIFFAGLIMFFVGTWMVRPYIALIATGLFLVVFAVLLAKPRTQTKPEGEAQ